MKTVKPESKFFPHLVRTIFVSLAVFALFFAVYFMIFLNKTLPNTHFGNLSIAGKNKAAVGEIVSNYVESYKNQKIKILVGTKTIEVLPADLGVDFDAQASLDKVYASRRSQNILNFFRNYFSALILNDKVTPVYSVNYPILRDKLNALLSSSEKPPQNSTIILVKAEPRISKSSNGIVVDRLKLLQDIGTRIDNLSYDAVVASYIDAPAKISESGAQKALERVKQLNNQNIVLYFAQEKWMLNRDKLFSILEFSQSGEDGSDSATLNLGNSQISIKDIDYVQNGQRVLEVKLNEEKLDSFIGEIANQVNTQTVDATLEFDGKKVTKFTPAQDGQTLDQELTKKLVLEKVSIENTNFEKSLNIKLPVSVTRAKIANKEINDLGIRELIGSGVSYFAGSIPNRQFNIDLGSKLISGTIVAPGEVFSFNKLVGPVSAEQGFKQAYVIQKGRTVLDDGGGICQVSTTVFRAALNSGLPIVARTAHAYRVGYYEQRGFKPGFDATIFSPSVDFQFKNDTANHILVQAKVDPVSARLQVDIYGTADRRRVEISDAVVSNITPAPTPKYQDEPSLPKGVTKQVDFEALGATSIFGRKVYKGNDLVIDETFKSNFRPWQAVYLVGTGG